MKSFEVQISRGGTWRTDSTYDHRELAEQRARQHETLRRHDAVRVVEEAFVEKTQKYVRRTVYRDVNFQNIVQEKIDNSRTTPAHTKNARQSPRKGPEETPQRRRKRPASGKEALSLNWILGILTLIIVLGAGSMFALRHFGGQS